MTVPRSAKAVASSPKVSRLQLDGIDLEGGINHVARSEPFRQAARIDPGSAVMGFVASPVRPRKRDIAVAHAGEFRREVGELVRDEVDHFALALNLATVGTGCEGIAAATGSTIVLARSTRFSPRTCRRSGKWIGRAGWMADTPMAGAQPRCAEALSGG